MNTATTGMGTKKKNKATQQLIPNTERKTSGCNWEMYKNLFPKPKTEESHSQQNKRSRSKRIHTTLLHTVSVKVLHVYVYY